MARVRDACARVSAVALVLAFVACSDDGSEGDGHRSDSGTGGSTAVRDAGMSGTTGSGGSQGTGGSTPASDGSVSGTGGGGAGGTSTGGSSGTGGSSAGGASTGGASASGGASGASGSGGSNDMDAAASGGTVPSDASDVDSAAGGTTGGPDATTDGSIGTDDGGAGIGNQRPVVSGTRLKAKFVEGPDGARIYHRGLLHDSELGIDCAYRKAGDGVTRCLPPTPPAGWGSVVFTDAECENGLVWIAPPPSGCTTIAPAYAVRYTEPPYCTPAAGEPDLHAHVHPVGALLPPQSGPFYRINGSGACVTGGATTPNAIPFAIGDEIPPSRFVAGTTENVP